MKLFTALTNWWKNAAAPIRIGSILGTAVVVTLVVALSISANGVSQPSETKNNAKVALPSQASTQSASATPTPAPSESESPQVDSNQPQNPRITNAPQAVAAPPAPVAPVFDAFTASAGQYGIGILMDNGPSTFPTGRIYATAALPAAQGTGPLSYSVSGLPVGADFDADQRKIFIDADTFIPANQENYIFNVCYQKQRINLAISVQYSATGPGGQVSATVPLQFGAVALGAGIFRTGC